jgi:hypothetical protein
LFLFDIDGACGAEVYTGCNPFFDTGASLYMNTFYTVSFDTLSTWRVFPPRVAEDFFVRDMYDACRAIVFTDGPHFIEGRAIHSMDTVRAYAV